MQCLMHGKMGLTMTRQEKLDMLSKACEFASRQGNVKMVKQLRLQILRIILRQNLK